MICAHTDWSPSIARSQGIQILMTHVTARSRALLLACTQLLARRDKRRGLRHGRVNNQLQVRVLLPMRLLLRIMLLRLLRWRIQPAGWRRRAALWHGAWLGKRSGAWRGSIGCSGVRLRRLPGRMRILLRPSGLAPRTCMHVLHRSVGVP